MRSNLLGYAATAVAAGVLSINASAGTVTTDGEDIVIKTKGGFEAKRADDAFSFKLGGRVQVQYDQFQDSMNLIDGDGDTGSALFIRRARVYLKGTMYEDWAYKIQFNVADSGSGGGTCSAGGATCCGGAPRSRIWPPSAWTSWGVLPTLLGDLGSGSPTPPWALRSRSESGT